MLEGINQVLANLAQQQHVTLDYTLAASLPRIYGGRTLIRQICLEALSALISLPGAERVTAHLAPGPEGVVVEVVSYAAASVPETRLDSDGDLDRSLSAVRRLVGIAGGRWHSTKKTSARVLCRFELPRAEPKAILVIDDNEGMIRVFKGYLEPTGYEVIGCITGEEALQLAHRLDPAAITLDIMMPNQDGWEILLALRSDPATSKTPIVVCSVLEDPQLAFSLGADAYLSKPITQEKLLATLGELIG
jgi:CheY-like chemotaxis protein